MPVSQLSDAQISGARLPRPDQAVASRALWSALDAAATPASMLAILVGLVRALRPEDYGVLVMALAASAVSMASNPAIALSTTKFVSESRGRERTVPGAGAGVVTTSLLAVIVVDIILLGVVASCSEPLSALVFGDFAHTRSDVGRILLLSVVAVGIQQIDAVFAAAIRGMERFRLQASIEIVSRSTLAAAVIGTAWLTGSVTAVLVAQCAAYGVSAVARSFAVRGLLPERRIFGRTDRAQVVALLRYGGWMWLHAIAGVAYMSVDRILVGRFLGVAAAGRFNVYVQVTQLIHFVPSSLFAFSLPAFSRLGAAGERWAAIARAYRRYLGVAVAVAAVIAASIVLGWPVLSWLLGVRDSGNADHGVVVLLALNFFLLACNVVAYYLLLALGKSRAVSLMTAGSIAVALLLMFVLIPQYGLIGAAIARMAYGVITLTLLLLASRVLVRHG